jgi:peptide deformylase
MVLDIVIYGDPVLREKGLPVREVTPELRQLAEDMIETMRAANGVGLAAHQVAVPLQLAVVDVAHDPGCISFLKIDGADADLADWMPLVFTNPVITPGTERETDIEGCLSFPDLRYEVPRPGSIQARLTLLDGRTITLETDGLLARAIQHETDHLNGVLFIDRISSGNKLGLKRKIQKIQDEYGTRLKLDPVPGGAAPAAGSGGDVA